MPLTSPVLRESMLGMTQRRVAARSPPTHCRDFVPPPPLELKKHKTAVATLAKKPKNRNAASASMSWHRLRIAAEVGKPQMVWWLANLQPPVSRRLLVVVKTLPHETPRRPTATALNTKSQLEM